MPRYFLETAYLGTNYSGFQVQHNANTIQAEITRAFETFFKSSFALTGSSRTDAGVHAKQNFFHFDTEIELHPSQLYNLNSLLPRDIVLKNLFRVAPDAHCRFDAIERTYQYHITRVKDPFLFGRAYYYPYRLNTEHLQNFAASITRFQDFTAFSKRKTQVNHFFCKIAYSSWCVQEHTWRYEIKADRFLRGMVKGLVGTMLRLAKRNADIDDLEKIFQSKDCSMADFSPPSRGLVLTEIRFKPGIFLLPG
jgi:tRNA pseudouridine38-40 synthase